MCDLDYDPLRFMRDNNHSYAWTIMASCGIRTQRGCLDQRAVRVRAHAPKAFDRCGAPPGAWHRGTPICLPV